ncbi:unnamed protein product [Thelazia callipaeda]|uniref:Laminin EGF-like domain-containing protein n=1 Tax=Thelazia callipaeda TaxID=103827 RepID=A0A0N5CVL2_THECL|nr:unnamed protein product [Thelazia callipaeda]
MLLDDLKTLNSCLYKACWPKLSFLQARLIRLIENENFNSQPGYFNLTSGSGCQQCDCDVLGSINSTCDVLDGQCSCKPGVKGRRPVHLFIVLILIFDLGNFKSQIEIAMSFPHFPCLEAKFLDCSQYFCKSLIATCDQCEAEHYGFGMNGCHPCDCDVIGSESSQCDVISGQCLCRDHIEGRRCDHCIENRYNLQAGCLPCDDCYSLIQRRVHDFRKDVTVLEETLKEIIENPAPVDDKEFDNYVNSVSAEVENLTAIVNNKLAGDDSQLITQVNKLKKDLKDAVKLLDSVDDTIKRADGKASKVAETLQRWKVIKDGARNDLENALYYLETEGQTQWELAQEASRKYGEQSQQLSEIAQEALKLAEQQENRSAEIEALAEKIANNSKQALVEAKEAIFGGEAISKEIAIMMKRLNATEKLLNQTYKLAEEQLAEADRAYKAAAEGLTTVEGLRLPNINPQQIEQEAKRVAEDAQATAQNAKEQAAANKELIENATRILADAKYELQRFQDQQKVSDELLADVDAARVRIMDAVALAESTLEEAQHTLETLNDFQERVDASKSEAIEELSKLKDIENEIALAEDTTREAENAIGNAKNDAQIAEEIALQAEKEAKTISKKASELQNQTQNSREIANDLKLNADQLLNDVRETSTTMEDYRRQASTDKSRASEAVQKAQLAENAAENANKTIGDAQNKLKNIIDQLKSLDNVNSDELNELEKQLDEAEKLLDDADLDKQVSLLKEQKIEQDRTITQFKNEIDTLKDEVENLEEIRDSLPNRCFNVINLEQEGHK